MTTDKLVLDIVANDLASSKISNIESNIKKFGATMASITANISSFMSLNDAFDKIEKKAISVKEQELALAKQQELINKLMLEGKEGTNEYSHAIEKLNIMQREYNVKLDELQDAQNSANLQLVTFASTMATTVLTSLTSVTSAVKAFHMASSTAFVTSPIGIAIIGISTAIGVLAFNVGGLRDKLFSALEGFISWLKALPILGDILRAIEQLLRSIGLIKDESNSVASTFSTNMANMSASVMEVEGSLKKAKSEMEEMKEIDPFEKIKAEKIQEKIDREFRESKRRQELEFKIDILLDQALKTKDNFNFKSELLRELKKFHDLGGQLSIEQKIGLVKLGIDENIFSESSRLERAKKILEASKKPKEEIKEEIKEETIKPLTIKEPLSRTSKSEANMVHLENAISNLTSTSIGFKDMALYTKNILSDTKVSTNHLKELVNVEKDYNKELLNLLNVVKQGFLSLREEIFRLQASVTAMSKVRSSEVAIKNITTNKATITTLKKY
ncbi:MAG: hypothetical protein QW156_03845 [Candidatus Aenigmatarchaeota archaeon]